MRKILHIIRKEFIQVFRDPPTVAIIFIIPIVQLLVLGYAITVDVKNINMVIVDMDNSSLSRSLQQKMRVSGYFHVQSVDRTLNEVQNYFKEGTASVILSIPPDFKNNIMTGRPEPVQIILDGSDANTSRIAMGYVSGILMNFFRSEIAGSTQGIELASLMQLRNIEHKTRVWYNPNLESKNFMIPGIVVILLTMITTILTGLGLVREKERGTLEQIMVSPVRAHHLIIGKTIPFAVLGFALTTLAMTFGKLWFKIPIAGSLLLFYGFACVFLLTSLGLGILVSTVSKTQQQALFFIWFINIFAIIMSGFFIPVENMPPVLQFIAHLNPVLYFMRIVREIFLKGSTFQYLWKDGLILLGFGALIFSTAVVKFKERIS